MYTCNLQTHLVHVLMYTCNLQTHFDPFFRNPLKPLLHTTQIRPLPTKLVLNVCWYIGKSVILKREGRKRFEIYEAHTIHVHIYLF